MECERLVMRMGVALKPGSISPPNVCAPSLHLYHNRNTFPLRLDAKKTFFFPEEGAPARCVPCHIGLGRK